MTDIEQWLRTAVDVAAKGVMRAAFESESDGIPFTDETWTLSDEAGREEARRAGRHVIDALLAAGLLATPDNRAALLRELAGNDDKPGVLDGYFVHGPIDGAGPVVTHCRRDHHVQVIARNLAGDQTDLTLGEMVQAALEHEQEVHGGH